MTGPLKIFQYALPRTAGMLTGTQILSTAAAKTPALVKIHIDFEKGRMQIDADWQFIVPCKEHVEEDYGYVPRKRVVIDSELFPARAVDLDNIEPEGLVFTLLGQFRDGRRQSCSGFLIIDHSEGEQSADWQLTLYLYDTRLCHCEIAFRVPLFTTRSDHQLN